MFCVCLSLSLSHSLSLALSLSLSLSLQLCLCSQCCRFPLTVHLVVCFVVVGHGCCLCLFLCCYSVGSFFLSALIMCPPLSLSLSLSFLALRSLSGHCGSLSGGDGLGAFAMKPVIFRLCMCKPGEQQSQLLEGAPSRAHQLWLISCSFGYRI